MRHRPSHSTHANHHHPCTKAPLLTDKATNIFATAITTCIRNLSAADDGLWPSLSMAAAHHSRTRSDRVGASAAAPASRRPLSMHGRPAAAAGLSAPAVVKAAPPSPLIPTFLTNLRLLDLDLADDWPDITPATFAGTTQNHKRRVQAVEWALYRLFEIWDPEETASVCCNSAAAAAAVVTPYTW